ncbi:hypothetical protein, partial [Actinomadura sp. KC216]|uniref:hypothetical protein n=1 Tax=Actinomadura sp. KC216 TaxID=2530370 RepID=UPI001A9D9DA3
GAAGAAGKGGVISALGAKGTAAVAGGAAAVAAGGGAAVYVTVADDAPKPPPIAARLVALSEPRQDMGRGMTFQAQGQIVRVTGGDPALTRKIDQALRAPLEQRWTKTRNGLRDIGRGPYTDVVRPQILMRNDRLLSVWYTVTLQGERGSGWDNPAAAVVDLRTGTLYRPPGLFRAATRQALAPLDARIEANLPGGGYCGGDADQAAPPGGADTPSMYVNTADVAMALTPKGVRVAFHAGLLGYTMACGTQDAVVPYGEVDALLKPELLAAVRSPSPERS